MPTVPTQRRPVSPLARQVRIANQDGTPTSEFVRLWQETLLIMQDTEAAIAENGGIVTGALDSVEQVAAVLTSLTQAFNELVDNEIVAGTGLEGGGTLGSGDVTVALEDTGVTPGTFGSATEIPVITVDAQGRITSVTTVAAT